VFPNRALPLPLSRFGLLLLAPLLACGSDDPAGPGGGGGFPMEWNFTAGLEGWQAGTRPGGEGGGDVGVMNGMAVLNGFGEPGDPDAWISRTVQLPVEPMSLAFDALSGCGGRDDGDSFLYVTVTSPDWAGEPLLASDQISADQTTPFLLGLNPYAGMEVTITFQQDDEGEQEDGMEEAESICIDDVVISEVPAK
jgi:hypothetical protein